MIEDRDLVKGTFRVVLGLRCSEIDVFLEFLGLLLDVEDCVDADDGVLDSLDGLDVLEGCDLIESSSYEFLPSDPFPTREPRYFEKLLVFASTSDSSLPFGSFPAREPQYFVKRLGTTSTSESSLD